nr:reverse transcriptase domain-containing protein [Tanacetum cinerariifolium]
MTEAAIRQLVADSITTALEAQAANMANTNNTNRNPEPREAPIARKCSYKEFMSCQRFNFKGLGYNAVPPPTQVYSPPKKDMSWTGLPEFTDDTITDYSRPSPTIETDCPGVIKNNKTKTAWKPPIKYTKMYRNTTKSPKVRGTQRNWNNMKTQQLGKDFVMKNKACFNCGQFDHLAYNCGLWVEKRKTWAKNNYTHKSMSPRTIFCNTGTTSSVNKPNMNVAQPKRTSFAKPSHSYVRRPFHRRSTVRTQSKVPRVPTVTKRFPTVDLKFSTVKSTFSADWGNKGKAVKASAC